MTKFGGKLFPFLNFKSIGVSSISMRLCLINELKFESKLQKSDPDIDFSLLIIINVNFLFYFGGYAIAACLLSSISNDESRPLLPASFLLIILKMSIQTIAPHKNPNQQNASNCSLLMEIEFLIR